MSSQQQPTDEPVYDDRVYRSSMAVVTGVLLLGLTAWLCGDAAVRGSGNTPWIALALALCAVPLIVAFTIRPAVFANDDRMRVRNPFRVIELPWAAVDTVRAGYSAEVLAEGSTYQLWSVPVSLRERKKANRRQLSRRGGLTGRSLTDPAQNGAGAAGPAAAGPAAPQRAGADRVVDELRELAERGASRAGARGGVRVHWSYEVIAPAVAGAVLLVVLLVAG
ncbi:PH domain-containing protein [Streptomyces antarcticus]|uniref:PH domain-containing protein n=1 Tax=Streptomyces antarcticus TaxID=2996458 RepID=UPI002270329E|nr:MULTISPECIES: PH domain-containing protein [unclassified Streptomyces]MCY0944066.1 PH domain-containing protein [Streptomyces sp. H34-AA3]MCY0952949.1 PH domain-containing protein [Streptomyces sp. H27-S2]MCZ4082234.1 PH domain-containing protein [Streptomyces sp. H34-S5]